MGDINVNQQVRGNVSKLHFLGEEQVKGKKPAKKGQFTGGRTC